MSGKANDDFSVGRTLTRSRSELSKGRGSCISPRPKYTSDAGIRNSGNSTRYGSTSSCCAVIHSLSLSAPLSTNTPGIRVSDEVKVGTGKMSLYTSTKIHPLKIHKGDSGLMSLGVTHCLLISSRIFPARYCPSAILNEKKSPFLNLDMVHLTGLGGSRSRGKSRTVADLRILYQDPSQTLFMLETSENPIDSPYRCC